MRLSADAIEINHASTYGGLVVFVRTLVVIEPVGLRASHVFKVGKELCGVTHFSLENRRRCAHEVGH